MKSVEFDSAAFVERIRARASELDDTKTGLLKAAGFGDSIFQQWKDGRVPKANSLLKLAQALDCSVGWLVTGEENGRIVTTPEDEPDYEAVPLEDGRVLVKLRTVMSVTQFIGLSNLLGLGTRD